MNKKKDALGSAFGLMLLTLLGKLFGFVRGVVMAYFFGATVDTDSFNLAFGLIGNVLYALTTGVGVAFLPLYLEKKHKEGEEALFEFVSNIGTMILGAGIIVSIVIFIAADLLASLVAPSYSLELRAAVAMYIRMLSSCIVFYMLSNYLSGLLNAEKIYGYVAISGMIYSIVSVVLVMFYRTSIGVDVLAYSVIYAYIIQAVVLIFRSRRFLKLRIRFKIKDDYVKRFAAALLPIMLGNAFIEINQLVDMLLASDAREGAVTALNYGGMLSQFVTTIIITSVVTVSFTELSIYSAEESYGRFINLCKKTMVGICMLLLPFVCIVAAYSNAIVSVVYGHGAFDGGAVSLTATVLFFYALNFIFMGISALLIKGFYALGSNIVPMACNILSVIINIACSVLLYRVFGFPGIPLGTLVATGISAGIEIAVMHRKVSFHFSRQDAKDYVKLVIAAGVGLALILLLKAKLAFLPEFEGLCVVTAVFFAVYVLILKLLKFVYLDTFLKKVRVRIMRH